jgi:hypothetical protein
MNKVIANCSIGFLVVLVFSGFLVNQAMIIVPGQSVGPFDINKTTYKQLIASLGKAKLKKHSWLAPDCGKSYNYQKLEYLDRGLSFLFFSEDVRDGDSFGTIVITKPCNAATNKGIAAGYSTRANITAAYGQPSDLEDKNKMEYDSLGITFEFVNDEFQTVDTLQSIYICKPK